MAKQESFTCPGGNTFTAPKGVDVTKLEFSPEHHKTIANGGKCIVRDVLDRNSFENEEIASSSDCGRCATHVAITVSPIKVSE